MPDNHFDNIVVLQVSKIIPKRPFLRLWEGFFISHFVFLTDFWQSFSKIKTTKIAIFISVKAVFEDRLKKVF